MLISGWRKTHYKFYGIEKIDSMTYDDFKVSSVNYKFLKSMLKSTK